MVYYHDTILLVLGLEMNITMVHVNILEGGDGGIRGRLFFLLLGNDPFLWKGAHEDKQLWTGERVCIATRSQ